MESADGRGFESQTDRQEAPSLEEELAVARQTLAEAREMLEGALQRVTDVSEGALGGELDAVGEAAPP